MPRKETASKKRKVGETKRVMPNHEFMRREVQLETKFPLVELGKIEECQWTLALLKDNDLEKIAKPAAEFAYPRLVRLFYQNLTYGANENGGLYFKFDVDGHKATITEEDMEVIMGVPHVFDAERTPHLGPPLEEPQEEKPFDLLLRQFSEDGKKGTGSSILVSSMPPRVWLLDKILRDNVYPLGHNTERREMVLWALYSAHMGRFFSFPSLAVKGIVTMGQEIRSQSPTGMTRALPYGYLVTAILDYTDYAFSEKEIKAPAPKTCKASSLGYKFKTMMNAREARAKAAAGASSTSAPPTGPPAPTPHTFTSPFEIAVMERFDQLESYHADYSHMMRAMAEHTLGDGYQAMMDTRPSVVRRGKEPAAEESGSSSGDEEQQRDGDDDEATDDD